MIHGSHNDAYFVLFEEQSEALSMTARYGIDQYLPGFTICGLRGWDDFILRDRQGHFFTVPTVPLLAQHVAPYDFQIDLADIKPDARIGDRIKWYIKPLVFGGDPQAADNMAWISLDQHVDAVRWWNKIYRDVSETHRNAEPCASPNGDPATPPGNAGATERPPSVS